MKQAGFTLIEIIVALTVTVVLSLASANFLFSIISQRDQALAEAILLDQIEAVHSLVAGQVRSARTIEVAADGYSLELAGNGGCWLFAYNAGSQRFDYGFSAGSDCQAPPPADQPLTSQKARVTTAEFRLVSGDSSSRAVGLNWTAAVARPFWQTSQELNRLFVNITDTAREDDD